MHPRFLVLRNGQATERMMQAAVALADKFGMDPPDLSGVVKTGGPEVKRLFEREAIADFMDELAAASIGASYVGYDEARRRAEERATGVDPNDEKGDEDEDEDQTAVIATAGETPGESDSGQSLGGLLFGQTQALPPPAVTGPDQPPAE